MAEEVEMQTTSIVDDMQSELHDKPSNNNELSELKKWKLIAFALFVLLLIVTIILIVIAVIDDDSNSSSDDDDSSCSAYSSTITHLSWDDDEQGLDFGKYGFWETIIPNQSQSASIQELLGMQTVHSVLLPSGKVLLFSGSAWRNNEKLTETYPKNHNPSNAKGLFNKFEHPFLWSKAESYYSQVNFNGIYDPTENTFFRVPHPLPSQTDPDNSSYFVPTDLFCSGQHHVRDGNVLLIGGTQYYYPIRSGTRATHIFNWTQEAVTDWTQFNWTVMPNETSPFYPFKFSGLTHRGRWYPHAVPLLDGRLVIFSGFIGFDKINDFDMYEFETNKEVEFFNYDKWLTDGATNESWIHINVANMSGSPFATELTTEQQALRADCSKYPYPKRQCRQYKFDAFKLYPNNYLLKDGRIYLSREGDWNSLRDINATCIRRVNMTYFMHISGDELDPSISWSRGPDRPSIIVNSGTTVMDPNSGNINRYGGMPIETGGTMLPSLVGIDEVITHQVDNRPIANQYAGSRATRQFDLYTIPKNIDDIGEWTLEDKHYLGDTISDDRTMHYALILPTKQILIIGGGNYDFYAAVLNPLLLTPIYDDGSFTGNYTKEIMAPARQSRLYHSGAILIGDARILLYGGNAARASIDVEASEWDDSYNYSFSGQLKPNLDRINRFTYFLTDSSIAEGSDSATAENWIMEFFYPPYWYIDLDRGQTLIDDITSDDNDDYVVSKELSGKTYFLIHSLDTFTIELSNLPDDDECDTVDGSLVIIKLGLVTHGWDSGQRLYDIAFDVVGNNNNKIEFTAPNATLSNIPPAFYTLWYVDCMQKPSVSAMVRFDDEANSPF